MKKVLFGLLAVLLVFCFTQQVWAQTPWPDRSEKKTEEVVKAPAPKAEAPVSAFKFGLNNLSGDVGIIWKGTDGDAAFMPGIGIDLMTYKQGLVTLRGQAFFESEATLGDDNAAVVGISVMVNLIKLVGSIPDTNWLANAINPSLGVFGGYDVVSGKAAYGPMISIINVQF